MPLCAPSTPDKSSVTGVIAASPSEPGKLALCDGTSSYILADQTKARVFAGRKVRVIGILHESTGLLELRNIDPLPRSDRRGTFALDRAPDTP